MGMDLVAHRQSADPDAPENCFHANWTWWGVLTGLLARLDADLSECSGSNDGDPVKEETAQQWARLVQESLEYLYVVDVPSTTRAESSSTHLVPGDGVALLDLLKMEEDLTIHFVGDTPGLRKYLDEFVFFLQSCGGFSQF